MKGDKALLANTSSEKKFSASISEKKNDFTKEVRVREIENGFLVTIEERGYDKKNNWFSEDKEYFSKTNPLNNSTIETTNKSLFEQTMNNIKEML